MHRPAHYRRDRFERVWSNRLDRHGVALEHVRYATIGAILGIFATITAVLVIVIAR